jgi:NAD(P)-dependent dehydrogenase (short-subunit alcohol dehydrogenase family)
LVTGGAQGIGHAIARRLAIDGLTVHVADIAPGQMVDSVVDEGRGSIDFIKCDVSDSSAVDRAVEEIVRRSGPVHVLVNNAGIDRPRAVWELGDAEWQAVLGVNLSGPFFMTRAVLRSGMLSTGGSIVNISSFSGLRGTENRANYAASKP